MFLVISYSLKSMGGLFEYHIHLSTYSLIYLWLERYVCWGIYPNSAKNEKIYIILCDNARDIIYWYCHIRQKLLKFLQGDYTELWFIVQY